MQSLALWHYRRPFRAPMPLRTRHRTLLLPAREGLLLAWRVADRQLWTEVAPLPLFSPESLPDAHAALLALMRSADILGFGQLALRYPDHATGLPASVQYGLETGLAWLSTPTTQPKDKSEFSPQLCGLALPGTAQTSPYRVVKQKIDGIDFNQDCRSLIAAVTHLGPGQRLRIDANGSWSLAQAIQALSPLPATLIDYIEEPLRAMSLRQCRALHGATGLPLALDESLRVPKGDLTGSALDRLSPEQLRACGVRALVIKPMLTGFRATQALLELCTRRPLQAVLSSAFESSVALNHYWQLAHHHRLSAAQGLATAHFFADAEPDPLGTLVLPPGLTHVADLF
jgi:O-succinylbenzoate synthase